LCHSLNIVSSTGTPPRPTARAAFVSTQHRQHHHQHLIITSSLSSPHHHHHHHQQQQQQHTAVFRSKTVTSSFSCTA